MMRSRHRLTIHAHQFPALEMSPTVSPAFTVPVTPIESMTTARVALITGVTGQDGRYLAEFLLARGYQVHGTVNYGSLALREPPTQVELSLPGVQLHAANLLDGMNLQTLLEAIHPQEIYHLGAQSDVRLSFQIPLQTAQVNVLGTLRLLEAIRAYTRRTGKNPRLYQASSSEIFGQPEQVPQTEQTPFHPRNPYACSKVYSFWQTVNYREAYGIFACNGITYNHESPRRGELYVTRKITRAAGRIKFGLQKKLRLGQLDAQRDWGYAGDYVQAMWLMLQQDQPDDYIIATGETHSVREFLDEVFSHLDLDWHDYVEVDQRFFRPADVGLLCGDATKARDKLGWTPQVSFRELARLLTDHDLQLAQAEHDAHHGYQTILDPAT